MRVALPIAAALAWIVAAHAEAADRPSAVIDRADCQRLVRHVPDADVNYKPGVDVQGRAVAPADMSGGGNAGVPDKIRIDLQIYLAQAGGNTGPQKLGQSYVNTGTVTVDPKTGAVALNGQPVSDDAAADIAEACRKAGVR
ncbi:MAG TPA: hypothetical protein VEU47_07380 [Candidatus Cybelea sp.]|nr:hypothetical protein [Candidatus Cybelea sp.]